MKYSMQNVNLLSRQTSFLFCTWKPTTMAITIAMAVTPLQLRPLLCNSSQLPPKPSFSLSQLPKSPKRLPGQILTPCFATRNSSSSSKKNSQLLAKQDESFQRKLTQAVLFVALFASVCSFGIHAHEAPVLHPMSEGLFNFVVGWTFMFAPLLYADFKNGRYKGFLDVLWGLQMFLTNTFLIPYMAIRLNEADANDFSRKPSLLGSVMTKGAPIVGLVGGAVCALSLLWAVFGRTDGNFGNVNDRWNFLLEYLGSERLAYAFIWDIVLYTIFQPWLIGENLANVAENRVMLVNYIKYIPVIGLSAYLLFLKREREL